MMKCNVCGNALEEALYESDSARALTSLCTIYEGTAEVYFCKRCGHLQSTEIENIDGYYDCDYDILVASEDEDQIYAVSNGNNIYRTEHQVSTLLLKVSLPNGAKILDYGCAKSSTMRVLLNKGVEVSPYLFDVSDRYVQFWERFLTSEHWATYDVPVNWDNKFDVVTSFFSLEHMARPQDSLRQIFRVLKPSGIFYGIVPSVFTNIADMIVVDHVNHFTAASLSWLLLNQGFDVVEIDEKSHRGALVFTARKCTGHSHTEASPASSDVQIIFDGAHKIAAFWKQAGARIRAFEESIPNSRHMAIYGAGFYGTFILSCLTCPERIGYFVDQNPFLHGKKLNGVLVVSPTDLPGEIDTILTGLNPLHAKNLIDDIQAFKARNLNYFFM
jgi:SAM-dependent methyltransferase